jgi:hypothetical protein
MLDIGLERRTCENGTDTVGYMVITYPTLLYFFGYETGYG